MAWSRMSSTPAEPIAVRQRGAGVCPKVSPGDMSGADRGGEGEDASWEVEGLAA